MSNDQNKKPMSLNKMTFITALTGAITFVSGYFLNNRLPHEANSVSIGNETNMNDGPSFQCGLVTLDFAKGNIVCGVPGSGPIATCNTNSCANITFF